MTEMDRSSIHYLIYNLNRLRTQESPITNSILDFDLLLNSLHELDSMIEMTELKDAISKQIKFLLVNKSSADSTKLFDDHMLHTVIYGPPGVGKTRVCTILVKIWLSLGIIKTPTQNETISNSTFIPGISETKTNQSTNEPINLLKERINILNLRDNIKNGIVENLQGIIMDLKNEIKIAEKGFSQIKTQLSSIRSKLDQNELTLHEKINQNTLTVGPNIDSVSRKLNQVETRLHNKRYESDPDEYIEFDDNTLDGDDISETQFQPPDLIIPSGFTFEMLSPKPVDTKKLIKIVSREDFVGGFLGQSALKTEKLLKESLGKVVFIDEAYSLVHDEKDSYGQEALTVLNRFMSEHPEELVIIFAGYKDMLEKTIFHYQPGLKSRCTWMFEIDGYTSKGLSDIFKQQILTKGWKLGDDVNMYQFFRDNKEDFPAYGRDTHRLAFYCKMCYTETVFDSEDIINNKTISNGILNDALKYLRKNRITDGSSKTDYPHIYM